ncbi:MAS2 larger subunit of the mitochondrial processing protease-like protein [Dipodascopsis tothii]|uniref:MAS2 larger subunit of the mitochondrial processing protease-like protein n=1 Tax=Dipodascopsis tothii TaxID=44089 RepID=UPI0034CE8E7D
MLARLSTGGALIGRRALSTQATGSFQLTRLANGVRVATDGAPGHFSALGIYVDAGSRYEAYPQLAGLSHIMDRLAFKATQKRSGDEMADALDKLGGNYMCASSREALMYQAAVFNQDVEAMFGLVADTVRWPDITREEVQEQLATAEYEIREIWQKPELIQPEIMHMAAFHGNTLGNPLLCPEEQLSQITPEHVLEYRRMFFTPERTVAAFVGVDHARAVQLAEQYLGDMPAATLPVPDEPARYTGGLVELPPHEPIGNLPELAYVHLAFEGLSISDPDLYALATLQTLLGGGGSFSAGGPGKGMYSRLYTNVLNQNGALESCQAFNHSYTDSGLFGIAGSCIPEAAHTLTAIMCYELVRCMLPAYKRHSLSEREVQRAKNQLRSSLLMNLESRMIELEDLGRQVQVHGTKIPAEEMCDKIERLTADDIRRVARRVLVDGVGNGGSGKPTVVLQGREGSFGDVLDTVRRFGLGK